MNAVGLKKVTEREKVIIFNCLYLLTEATDLTDQQEKQPDIPENHGGTKELYQEPG
jgi:hypothetical protein